MRTTAHVTVRHATFHDAPPLTSTLVNALVDTPDAEWFIPDDDTRHAVYAELCTGLIDYILDNRSGVVYTVDDQSAVAIWYPDTSTPPSLVTFLSHTHAHSPTAERIRQAEAALAAHSPSIRHHRLGYLAVAPDRQCTGLGGALLRHRHATFDSAGIPAYLVATSTGSRDLFARHGYRLMRHAPIRLPHGGPAFWPMWRQPCAAEALPRNPR
ncbi:N-acetyltransferase [Micromonospora sp. WMMD1102]|uniref:GNAT family N-acetyltransferase n=1 Tax=Micromonospora sp. WMMD1102 TaxID=3016105 RepID=UPI0024151361|nr:N-acetyltransferase [Micromonospora sp. WMMD1102]MDG4790170.1 N-acetyltransferase [Micromonospora sp. WMMD1102]